MLRFFFPCSVKFPFLDYTFSGMIANFSLSPQRSFPEQCVNGTEGFSISLEVGADGEVRGQLRNDEEMGKWMKAKPEEYEIKCLRGPNQPGRHTKSENNWQRTRKNRKAKIQDIIFFKTFQRTGVKRTESYEGMIKKRISEFNIWRIKFI